MEIESEVFGEDNALESELLGLSNDEIRQRIRAFENEVRIMKSDMNRIKHEAKEQMSHVKDNKEKVKMNKVVSYSLRSFLNINLVCTITVDISATCSILFIVCLYFINSFFAKAHLSSYTIVALSCCKCN